MGVDSVRMCLLFGPVLITKNNLRESVGTKLGWIGGSIGGWKASMWGKGPKTGHILWKWVPYSRGYKWRVGGWTVGVCVCVRAVEPKGASCDISVLRLEQSPKQWQILRSTCLASIRPRNKYITHHTFHSLHQDNGKLLAQHSKSVNTQISAKKSKLCQ